MFFFSKSARLHRRACRFFVSRAGFLFLASATTCQADSQDSSSPGGLTREPGSHDSRWSNEPAVTYTAVMLPSSLISEKPALPLLVTGLTGVSGFNAFRYFQSLCPGQVVAIRQASNWPLSGPGIEACDAEDEQELSRLFAKYHFRSVLNCAGNCALKSCELDPEMAYRINLRGVRNLLHVIDQQGGDSVRLVHVSIDLVFSGRGQGGHSERDRTDPVTVYGNSMVAAETLVGLSQPEAAILRISLPMGVSYSGHAGAIDWIQARFQAGKPATLYFDEVRTPTYTDCLNRVFHYALTRSLAGLYHAGGTRRLSLYQIAQIVNRIGGYDPDLLQGCYRVQAGPMPPRAGNVTMDSQKLADAIGHSPFDCWPLDEMYVPTDRRWHTQRGNESLPSNFQGSPDLLSRVLYNNPNAESNHNDQPNAIGSSLGT